MFENGTYSTNTQSFIGFVQQGKIFDSYGKQLGVTSDEYNKAIDTAKGFEKILYEKGILQKPKTPEEINQELQATLKQTQDMMASMAQSIASLNNEVKSLKDQQNEQTSDNESGGAISKSGQDASGKQSV